MRMIIAAKYKQRCRECGGKIKAGTLVNWERGHGIWHYPDCSVSPDVNTKDSYSLEVNNREEEVMSSGNEAMGSDDNGGTINISDLIKALHGMTEKKVPVVESEPEIVSVKKKQKRPANMGDVRKSRFLTNGTLLARSAIPRATLLVYRLRCSLGDRVSSIQ